MLLLLLFITYNFLHTQFGPVEASLVLRLFPLQRPWLGLVNFGVKGRTTRKVKEGGGGVTLFGVQEIFFALLECFLYKFSSCRNFFFQIRLSCMHDFFSAFGLPPSPSLPPLHFSNGASLTNKSSMKGVHLISF